MAATSLITIHINKGKLVAQCLAARIGYTQNAKKTNDEEFISSYKWNPMTIDEGFLFSNWQYKYNKSTQQNLTNIEL